MHLPDGRVQTVRYTADHYAGYVADVSVSIFGSTNLSDKRGLFYLFIWSLQGIFSYWIWKTKLLLVYFLTNRNLTFARNNIQ